MKVAWRVGLKADQKVDEWADLKVGTKVDQRVVVKVDHLVGHLFM